MSDGVTIGLSVIMFDLHESRQSDIGGTFHAMYNVTNSQFGVHVFAIVARWRHCYVYIIDRAFVA